MAAVIAALGGIRGTIFASIAALALVFGGIQTLRLSASQHALEVQTLALEANAKKFAEWKLEAEAKLAAKVEQLDLEHRKEQENAKSKADRVVADLRNDVVRLRKRFTCPPGGEPSATDSPVGRTDGEGGGGLTGADAEFLIREAADSDRKSIKINALIDIIEAYLKRDK